MVIHKDQLRKLTCAICIRTVYTYMYTYSNIYIQIKYNIQIKSNTHTEAVKSKVELSY